MRPCPVSRVCLSAGLLLLPLTALAQSGTISGSVRVEGPVPEPRLLQVTKNHDVCGDTLRARDIMVDAGKVASAVVFIEGLDGDVAPAEYRLSNSGCMFDPPVLAATTGGTLIVDNHDDVLHNTHLHYRVGKRSRTIGNWGLAGTEAKIEVDRPLRRAGVIDVSCDAHPWMSALIMVFDHLYFSVTGTTGAFEIRGVPAGTHLLKISHAVLGEVEQSVTVTAETTTPVTIIYNAQ